MQLVAADIGGIHARLAIATRNDSGQIKLSHEASVLAGGLLPRMAHRLSTSGFHSRFTAKGRFESRMAAIPIVRITSPEPGLRGAAAACFAERPA